MTWWARQRASYFSSSRPPTTMSGSSRPAGRPPTRRCVRVASAPQTVQMAVSLVTSSARASSWGSGPKGRPRKSWSRPERMTMRPSAASSSAISTMPWSKNCASSMATTDERSRETRAGMSAELATARARKATPERDSTTSGDVRSSIVGRTRITRRPAMTWIQPLGIGVMRPAAPSPRQRSPAFEDSAQPAATVRGVPGGGLDGRLAADDGRQPVQTLGRSTARRAANDRDALVDRLEVDERVVPDLQRDARRKGVLDVAHLEHLAGEEVVDHEARLRAGRDGIAEGLEQRMERLQGADLGVDREDDRVGELEEGQAALVERRAAVHDDDLEGAPRTLDHGGHLGRPHQLGLVGSLGGAEDRETRLVPLHVRAHQFRLAERLLVTRQVADRLARAQIQVCGDL